MDVTCEELVNFLLVLLVMTVVTGGMAIGVIEPTLAPHLKDEVTATLVITIIITACHCHSTVTIIPPSSTQPASLN